MKSKRIWQLLKETAQAWDEDNVSRLAASLAYYTLLSIAPLVVLSVAVAGLALGQAAAREHIAGELGAIVGASAGSAVKAIAENAQAPGSGILSIAVGLVVLLFGASAVFGELQAALNTVWEVAPKPGRGLWGMVKDRIFSFAIVLAVAFLLLVSLVLSAALTWAGHAFSYWLPGGAPLWFVLNFLISFAVVTLLFAVLFKVIPDVKIQWRDVWLGATVTAGLFTLGKLLLGQYLGTAGVSSAYGAAGSLIALVIWVYYSAQILLVGAEFTEAYGRCFGSRIVPSESAVALSARPAAVEAPNPAE
jgi:membrane protein